MPVPSPWKWPDAANLPRVMFVPSTDCTGQGCNACFLPLIYHEAMVGVRVRIHYKNLVTSVPKFIFLLWIIINNIIDKASPLTFLQVYDTTTGTTLLHISWYTSSISTLTSITISHLSRVTQPLKNINMSPIIARAAMRSAAAAATTSSRTAVPRRNFSIIQSLRTFGRSLEAHPFERLPVKTQSAPADWGKHIKRTGKQAVMYVSLHHLHFCTIDDT